MPSESQLGASWYNVLRPVFDQPWWKELHEKVWKSMPNIQPEPQNIFRAFRETPFDQVKVVIIGQDPYPSGGYADGLAFSSGNGHLPKSLEYIYRELEFEYGKRPTKYSLEDWAHQGVLLLNTSLTVTSGKPLSHADFGWHRFIGLVLKTLVLNNPRDHTIPNKDIIFMVWGKPAKSLYNDAIVSMGFGDAVHAIEGIHPIAESYSGGSMKFVGGNYFKRVNDLLVEQGKEPIKWV